MGHEALWLLIGATYLIVAILMAILAGSFISWGGGGKKPTRCWYGEDGKLYFDED